MFEPIGSYVTTDLLSRGNTSVVYRARDKTSSGHVIVKCLRQANPSADQISRFLQEHEMTQALQMDGVVKLRGLEWDNERPFMVLEDDKGQSLDQLSGLRQFTYTEVLDIAVKIAQILSRIHDRNAVHKNINPANIIVNPKTGRLKLIDCGEATILRKETPNFSGLDAIEGTLEYIAPEQTGRINRQIDYRSDYYSLGVTIYELITGVLPFTGDSPMEIIHAHIAASPLPPAKINSEIPEMVSEIILTLLSKEPEDRYHSAAGLIHDIQHHSKIAESSGPAPSYRLREGDIFNRLEFGNRLYGRTQDVAKLIRAFERSREDTGFVQMLLVQGYPGIGKSSLVREIEKTVTLKNGYFVTGQFDQYRADAAYSGVIRALRQLIKLALAEDEAEVKEWRERVRAAVGSEAGVLVDILPELEIVVGSTQEVRNRKPENAQHHINLLLIELVRAFTSVDRPLVLFLDNCQWADTATISFLNLLMSTSDFGSLLLITAVRSNEAESDYRFASMIDDLRDKGNEIPSIELRPLTVGNVAEMLSDALGVGQGDVADLAAYVRRCTAGNPFLINYLVGKLCRDRQIYYHAEQHRWLWDIDKISSQEMIENAVELMVSEIDAVSPETGAILKIASCIGTSFDLGMLVDISGETSSQMAQKLGPAIENGWVVPLGRQYRQTGPNTKELPSDATIEIRFGHDRIRQAVYSSLNEDEQKRFHWTIGQYLLSRSSVDANHVLDVTNHLNLGYDADRAQDHAGQLLELNVSAGQRARTTGAYATSFDYFGTAVGLSKPTDWQTIPETMRHLFEGGAESAYLIGKTEEMHAWTEQLLEHAADVTQRTAALSIRIRAALAGGDQHSAVEIAIGALHDLGVELTKNPSQAALDAAVADVLNAPGSQEIANFSALPLMTDPHHLVVMRIYHSILAATYTNYPDLFVVLSAKMVRLSIDQGLSFMSIGAFADFSIVLCGRLGEFELGYQYGKLAIDLVEKLSAREVAGKVNFIFNGFVVHWTEHLRKTLNPLRDTFRAALEIGDLQYAALAAFDYGFNLFWLGGNLTRTQKELDRSQDAITRTKQEWVGTLNLMYRQAVADLSSTTRIDPSLTGDHFDADGRLPRLEAANASNAVAQVRILRLMLNYLFGATDAAVEEANKASQHLSGVAGTAAIPAFHFYSALAHLAQANQSDEQNIARVLLAVETSRKLLHQWADQAPMNYRHKHLLVEAEIAHLQGFDDTAKSLFEDAIELARDNNFLMEEALACELAGYFFQARGRSRQARHFLRDAHDAWSQCGATAKVRNLTAATDLLVDQSYNASAGGAPSAVTATQLDLSSVLQASQAISSEIVLPRLLKKLMTVLIENAGATYGVLLLKEAAGWSIQAEARVRAHVVEVQPTSRRLTDDDKTILPVSIIQAAADARIDVVLQDTKNDPEFASDLYFANSASKSILCHPIVMRSDVVGVLYLENDLVVGALSKDRLDVLKPLCAQAAISLENAKLHERQVNLTEAANRFVPNRLANVLGRDSLEDVQLGDHAEREMFLVVTDIRSFTTLSETMSPRQVFEFINGYLKATDPAFYDHGGIVVKFIGDSQMVAFPDSAESALDAAIAAQKKVAEFSAEQEALGLPPFGIGIGVHVGHAMLGIVGDEQRFQLDVLSDNVNSAARIEKLTRTYDASIIASQAVIEKLKDRSRYATRFLGLSEIRGRRETIGLHEILDAEPAEKKLSKTRTKAEFEKGITLLNKSQYSKASVSFSHVIDVDPDNMAAKYFLKLAELNILNS